MSLPSAGRRRATEQCHSTKIKTRNTNQYRNPAICRSYIKGCACFKGGNCSYLHPSRAQEYVATTNNNVADIPLKHSSPTTPPRSYPPRRLSINITAEQASDEILSKILYVIQVIDSNEAPSQLTPVTTVPPFKITSNKFIWNPALPSC